MEDEKKSPMEEALDRVQPYDERQREKIENLREKFRESAERRSASVANLRKYLDAPPPRLDDETRKLWRDRVDLNVSIKEGLTSAFEEQAELAERIAKALSNRKRL